MHDQPTADELLAAVESWLEDQLMPSVQGATQYNARVASNVIKTVRRELQTEESALDQEWRGLDLILGPADRPDTVARMKSALLERNAALCERIRNSDVDSGRLRELAMAHVRDTVHAKLAAANPGWLDPDTA